jgi:PAS domain S-box-containing protein
LELWSRAAVRLTAEETVGVPATLVFPPERLEEESAMIEAVRRGESFRQSETVRRHKDGSLVNVSLTASPIRDANGRVIAASSIARDVSELKRARERQKLLLKEMSHRVKNLFALAGSVVTLSARSAASPRELADSARERLAALARAHSLTVSHGETPPEPTTLQALVRAIVAAFDSPPSPASRSRESTLPSPGPL